jgi:hypothetical protein
LYRHRTGIGLTFKRYLSPGVERMPGELELSTVDPDMAFVAEFVHDGERIKDGDKAYFQLALLYTSPEGHRLVRVHNLALPVTTQVRPPPPNPLTPPSTPLNPSPSAPLSLCRRRASSATPTWRRSSRTWSRRRASRP